MYVYMGRIDGQDSIQFAGAGDIMSTMQGVEAGL